MSKNPKEVARTTAEKIVKDLLDTPRENPLSKDQVIVLLTKHIDDAYREINPADITPLYKAFSVLLHPDKQFSAIDSRLNSYLEQKELELTAEPFKILNRINQKYLLKNTTKKPKDGFNNFVEYFDHLMKPMEESLERYYQPVRFLAKAAYWALSIVVVAAVIISVIGIVLSSIVLRVANGLINFTLNTLTNNQYTKEVNDYLEPNFEEYKIAFLKSIRAQVAERLQANQKEQRAEQVLEMSDDDLFDLLINEEVEAKIQVLFQQHINPFAPNQEANMEQIRKRFTESLKKETHDQYIQLIKNSAPLSDFARLKLISLALYHAITKPLAEIEGNKLLSVILRPLQIVASPFILGAAILVKLADYTVSGLALTGVTLSLVAKAGMLVLLNTPLYAWDLCRYTVRKVQECVGGNENSNELVNGGPHSLLMLEWHHDKSPIHTEQPPLHSGTLFSKPKSELPAKNMEHGLQTGFSMSFGMRKNN
ncbi:hypothetical protein Lgra_2130 [Legionella gratiana]|uniref:Uncharacterized protein n=2 Tax=Legionella gratiana TaxID=45066 RepID=A0A378J972_9GAMM|nr:hypothetical protein Lgra_2130 [Legionella gratiana]STX44353.1 Uncharacterised protein [Legionella gratiana]